jgi:hypothetical protein
MKVDLLFLSVLVAMVDATDSTSFRRLKGGKGMSMMGSAKGNRGKGNQGKENQGKGNQGKGNQGKGNQGKEKGKVSFKPMLALNILFRVDTSRVYPARLPTAPQLCERHHVRLSTGLPVRQR